MAGVNVETVFTINVTNKSIGGLLDSLQKLVAAGVPSDAVLANTPDVVVIKVTNQVVIDRVSKALGRLP